MDKLFSEDQLKTFINSNRNRFGSEIAVNLARQLYDVMQENWKLKAKIEGTEGASAIEMAYSEDQRNKDTEHD